MTIFKLVRINKGSWEIRAPKDYVIATNFQGEKHEAEEWCKAIISSWNCNSYEIVSGEYDEHDKYCNYKK